jgi:hypothetical protein
MSDTPEKPSREEAEQLLAHAQRVSDSALAGISWRSVTTLVGLGATTSIGTLAMNLSTGRAYFTITTVMIVWVLIIIAGSAVVGNKSAALGFGKRWGRYIVAWAIAYGIAIACATSELKGNVLIACVASALIAIVTLVGAAREVRS